MYGLKKVVPVKKEVGRIKGGYISSGYKFHVGVQVKVSVMKRLFSREYDQQFMHEVFAITHRYKNQGVALYTLKDLLDEDLDGRFHEWELRKVHVDQDTVYNIERVIKRKKKQVLVRWLGWPKKFDSWISEELIQNVGE